jgi:hypothetical protein
MSVNLSPAGGAAAQFFDNNGNPLSGGKLFTYAAGTTTPQATYTTAAGNVAHTNPIILDSAGRVPSGGEIWLTNAIAYKFVLQNSENVLIGTYDNIEGINSTGVPITASVVSFTGFKGQVGTVQDLADNDGSDWVGFVQSGTGVVARSVQDKLREFWDVEDFVGATDQIKVQAAFDSGKPIKFSKNYSVDAVSITSDGQFIDFNGYALIGTRSFDSSRAQAVLSITALQLTLYKVAVNANFKNYLACIRWFSLSPSKPAQYNNVYGLSVAYSTIGLLYGQEIGTPSQDAAQSENAIYGFKCRGVQQAFVGNQSNGFITLVAPQLDCNPYEWVSQPGFDVTTWQTAARTINNDFGQVVILGGELLKTSTQLGYGIEGSGMRLIGTTIEIACANFLVGPGYLDLKSIVNFYMAADSTNVFTLKSTAGDGGTSIITLDSCQPKRADGVWSYSGSSFINGVSTTPVIFNFNNCLIQNWVPVRIANDNSAIVGAGQVSNAIVRYSNTKLINRNISGTIVRNITLQNTSSATTTAIASAGTIAIDDGGQIFHVSGTAAISIIDAPIPSFRGSVTIIPDGAFTLTTAGNIGKASTAVVGQAMTLHYDGVKWYPSY